jgi:hypothetical protein
MRGWFHKDSSYLFTAQLRQVNDIWFYRIFWGKEKEYSIQCLKSVNSTLFTSASRQLNLKLPQPNFKHAIAHVFSFWWFYVVNEH